MKHIALAVSLVAAASSAGHAQPTGTVQVRVVDSAGRPLDGTVTFRSGNTTLQCRTVASRCSIGLAAGTWSADVAPTRESSPGAQTVAVQAGSVASLTFRTRAAATTTATTTAAPTATTRTTTTTTTATTRTTTATTATPTVRANVQPSVGTAVAPSVTAPGVRTVTPSTATTATSPSTAPRATAPGVTATAPGVVTTAPGVTAVSPTVAPRVVTTTTTTPSTTATTRDLGRGTRVCAQGSVTDSLGRPADATVTVTRDGTTLGTVRSVAGRFSMFDLPPGRYALRAVSARDGSVAQQTLDLGPDVARVVVRVR
jgi:hypothetical protein